MAITNLYFNLTDSSGNPLTGSQCVLRAYGSSNPTTITSDIYGTASFSNVIPQLYQFTYSPSGYISQSYGGNYTVGDNNSVYVIFPSNATGSIDGFQYVINVVANNTTGSYGTEFQMNSSVSSMANQILNSLKDWCIINQGMAFIADDDKEKMAIGFNSCVGPRVRVVFTGESADGTLSEHTGRLVRHFDIVIERAKLMTWPRNAALANSSGNVKTFYDLVEECRDIVRTVVFPTPAVYNPIIYEGTIPMREEGWLMDSYVISFTIPVGIGRIKTVPPALTGANSLDYVGLIDPMNMLGNGISGV